METLHNQVLIAIALPGFVYSLSVLRTFVVSMYLWWHRGCITMQSYYCTFSHVTSVFYCIVECSCGHVIGTNTSVIIHYKM